mgnify:CR=1 FL=1
MHFTPTVQARRREAGAEKRETPGRNRKRKNIKANRMHLVSAKVAGGLRQVDMSASSQGGNLAVGHTWLRKICARFRDEVGETALVMARPRRIWTRAAESLFGDAYRSMDTSSLLLGVIDYRPQVCVNIDFKLS